MNKFLSLLFTVTYLFSQIYQFQNLGIEDGLSQSNVYSILQDQTNILWFATEDGLNNYDGNNFVVFKQSYSDALQSNDINEIVQDSKGNIWIGTWGGGLAKFIPASGEFISFTSAYQDSNSLSGNRVQSLFIDPDSNLWIGTSEHGLNQLVDEKTKRFKHYNTKNSMISNDRIWSIESNKSGELWLATENGLNHLNLKTGEVTIYFRETANNLSLNHSLIRCLYFDHSGKLWVGTEDGLHQMLEPGKFKRYLHDERDPHSISHNVINVVYEDSFDQLWIGTGAGGLNKFDRKTELFHSYKNDPVNPISLSSNDVRDIFEDHSLNLWISTRGGGISRINLKQKPFAHLTVYDGLTHNRTTSIAETPDNKLWIGTREGISIYDRKTSSYSYLTEGSGKERLKDNYVRVLSYDRSGGLMWIGTQNSGLASYDYKSNHMSYYESDPSNSNSPPLNEIQAIYQDGDYLWIGTEKGLSRLNKASGKFEHYLHDLNNGETSVITITGNDNTIFVGADDFGIYILDKSTMKMKQLVHHPDDPKTLINDVILCMLLDDQYLWIGTERGLNRYQLSSGEFKLFDTTTGLANASILAILADDQNNLWLSTNLGISKLDKSNFSVRNYNQIDGLLNTSFIRASAHHASDGMLYFGAFNGLTAIAPKQFRSENYKYPVRIRRVKSLVTGKDIDLSHKTELVLPAGENFFTIEFIAMDFTKSSRNRYQYKLSGFDPDWINSGTRNIATYTNVEPDTYTFQVKGSNSFNEWNGNITELTITIQPHFYQTFWFKLFIALMVLKILYLLYWLRVKLIKNKNTELRNEIRVRQKAEENLENLIHELETKNAEMERFTYTVSHDLKSPLITIKGFLGALENDMNEDKLQKTDYYFNHINSGVDKMDELLSELLNLSRIGHQIGKMEEINLRVLIDDVIGILHGQIQKANAEIKINGDLPIVYADYKRLSEVFQNLIDNAIKFRKAGSDPLIEIGTLIENQKPVFYVRDNGIGIGKQYQEKIFDLFERLSTDYEGTGVGLALVRRIIELHHGKIWMESENGNGTTFKFTLGDQKRGRNEKN